MTVSTTNSTQTFSGGQNVLAFNFSALVAYPQYIQVNAVALTGGAVTALSYGTQYTVTISTTGVGGTVIVTPSYGSNYNYIVYRQTAILQNSNYTNYNSFPATTLMGNLDQLTMVDQENNTNIKLTLSYPLGASTTYSTIIPTPSIGTVLGSDPTGTFLMNVPNGTTGPQGPVGPSGSSGLIVSSSTTDISVTTNSTTAILSAVSTGTTANSIVRLNSSAQLPAVSASLLTGALTLVTSGTLITASSLTIAVLAPGVWYKLMLNLLQNTSPSFYKLTFNGDATNNYQYSNNMTVNNSAFQTYIVSTSSIYLSNPTYSTQTNSVYFGEINFKTWPGNNNNVQLSLLGSFGFNNGTQYFISVNGGGLYSGSSALSSATITLSSGSTTGTWALYQYA